MGRYGGGYHAAVPGQRQDREDAQQSTGSGSGRRGRWEPRRAVPPEPPAQGRLLQPGAGSGELVAMETAGEGGGSAMWTPDPEPAPVRYSLCEGTAWRRKWSEVGTGELVPDSRQLSWQRNSLISGNGNTFGGTRESLVRRVRGLLIEVLRSPSLQT